jgi:hypothetical protein
VVLAVATPARADVVFNSYRCAGAANPRPSPVAGPDDPFACQNEWWQMADNGTNLRRLTGGTTPETARDAIPYVSLRNGRELVVGPTPTSQGGLRIFSQNPDGSDRRQLTPDPPDKRAVSDNFPVESPAEDLIAFEA